jgi:hypothetical protein
MGDTPIFSPLNYMSKDRWLEEYRVGTEENEILKTIKFLAENDADLNVINNHGYSPLMLAILRGLVKTEKYLVENGAELFPRPSKRLTRASIKQKACKIYNAKLDNKFKKRFAEIIADLFFGGESCEYLKSFEVSNRGRFVARCACFRIEPWFQIEDTVNEGVVSFEDVLENVRAWLPENESICDIQLIEQVAKNKLNKVKLTEEDNCVVCYSKKPIVTFFPCGHKVFCFDCHQISNEDHNQNDCACCRQNIKFYKVDGPNSKKTLEVAEKFTKMTLRKR